MGGTRAKASRLCHHSASALAFGLAGLVAGTILFGSELWSKPIAPGAWKLDAPGGSERWLIVHTLPSSNDANFHVEVLEASSADPPWKFRWLARHMAISETALRRSLLGPSKKRSPYPETYDSAYRTWFRESPGKVCTASVAECLATFNNRWSGP